MLGWWGWGGGVGGRGGGIAGLTACREGAEEGRCRLVDTHRPRLRSGDGRGRERKGEVHTDAAASSSEQFVKRPNSERQSQDRKDWRVPHIHVVGTSTERQRESRWGKNE